MSNPTPRPRRHDFLKTAAAAGATLTLLGGTAKGQERSVKIGLIGCGGRGRGAVETFQVGAESLNVGVRVVAVADYFPEKVQEAGERFGVPADRRFTGAKSYRQLLGTDVEIVLMASPPVFRPLHFEAAVEAGKHVFMEKPVAVDPPGARRIIAAGERARARNLAVGAGTQRRHARAYRTAQFLVAQGAIGTIKSGCVWWCQGGVWFEPRRPGEDDASYLARNWGGFSEMSGDHIVEQHVHNIDIANWFLGSPPLGCAGFGGRHRRRGGNIYDFFSVDYEYPGGVHIHSMCRQIQGCWGATDEFFLGTAGQVRPRGGIGGIRAAAPLALKPPEFPQHRAGEYVQEHVDLLQSILSNQPLNEARAVAESTLAGIMGRLSAYGGQRITWAEVMGNPRSPWFNLQLRPTAEDFELGDVAAPPEDVVPAAGR